MGKAEEHYLEAQAKLDVAKEEVEEVVYKLWDAFKEGLGEIPDNVEPDYLVKHDKLKKLLHEIKKKLEEAEKELNELMNFYYDNVGD